jgi:hypothetical protein
MEVEGRTTNMMIESLGRFFPNLDQEFNRANNSAKEILEKLNAQEAMIGSLLTKSGGDIKAVEDSVKIERLCITMGEEITFVKNFMTQVMNDQNTLIRTMIGDTRRAVGIDQLRWLNSNISQYESSNAFHLVVDNVPQCFNEIRRLVIKHNAGE